MPAHLERVFAAAADRYLDQSITAWEFARGKLRHDPVYRATLAELDATTGTLVDVGCGQGLTLAVLVEARAHAQRGEWPADAPRPAFDHLVGIDTRERGTRLASRALGDAAHIIHAAAPDGLPESFGAALLFDVLHLMPEAEQRRIVRGIWTRLPAGGLLLVREVDAAAGGGFQAVRIGNRIKALAVGRWRQTFHFRTASEWRAVFASAGFEVETRPMGEGTPFANVLFRLRKRERRSQIPRSPTPAPPSSDRSGTRIPDSRGPGPRSRRRRVASPPARPALAAVAIDVDRGRRQAW